MSYRVIRIKPDEIEIVHEILRKCGKDIKEKLTQELSEAWWEILVKYNAELTYEDDEHGTIKIKPPKFPIDKDRWESSPSNPISVLKRQSKINKLTLVLAKEDIPESLRGIAIQRGGMTVIRYDSDLIPPDFKPRVYGYCFPDEDLDFELYKIEQPNHEGRNR